MIIVILIVWFIVSLLFQSVILPYPIADDGAMRYGSIPWITSMLIVINVCVFVFWQAPHIFDYVEATTQSQQEAAQAAYRDQVYTFGSWSVAVRQQVRIGAVSSFTGLFMHGSFGHLLGNMLYLWVFGRRVEDACGPWRFLLFYLFAGMVAKMTSYIVLTGDPVPSIGASGAIAGLIGAFLVLFPGTRIRCVWLGITALRGIGIGLLRLLGFRGGQFRWTVALPALVLMLPLVASNLLGTYQSAQTRELAGNVNYVAHAGGLVTGLTILLFARKDLVNRFAIGRRL